jgi:isochorismate hydrolase
MKETYFLPGNTGDVARRLIEPVRPFRERYPWNMSHTKSALLVLDMQKYFLDPSSHAFIPSAEAIIPNIEGLQNRFFQEDLPVIHTFHTNDAGNAGGMKTWWRELVEPSSPNAVITDRLATPRAHALEKHQYDAFWDTGLDEMLRRAQVRQVVISGVMAHLCCETTARSAFVRGYHVLLAVDGIATYTLDFHRSTVLNLSHGFAVPVLTSEIVEALDQADSRRKT